MARRLSSFQTLALWTTGTTYFLILVGGLVRASGAGLGCPDWPRCFGSWFPPASAADLPQGFDPSQFNPTLMWTEYLNRLLGVTVGLLILATAISAWRHHRRTPHIFWPTIAAVLLVAFQGWLGGVVVQSELAAWIVTVHMVVALVIVSLLLYASVYAFFEHDDTSRAGSVRRGALAWTALILIGLTLIQVVLGTQVREGIDEAMDAGVVRSEALAAVGRFDYWHREAAWFVIAATAILAWLVWTKYEDEVALTRTTWVIMALVASQLLLGVLMAYVALTPAAQVAHLTGSSLLLGAETVVFLLARWLPARSTDLE
jgi:cytochrome c oxidase assembly protein subunit 15